MFQYFSCDFEYVMMWNEKQLEQWTTLERKSIKIHAVREVGKKAKQKTAIPQRPICIPTYAPRTHMNESPFSENVPRMEMKLPLEWLMDVIILMFSLFCTFTNALWHHFPGNFHANERESKWDEAEKLGKSWSQNRKTSTIRRVTKLWRKNGIYFHFISLFIRAT